jgi:hypothetical protein
MKSRSKASAVKKVKVTPPQNAGGLKQVGGSQSDDWNHRIVNDIWQALWRTHSDDQTLDQQFHAAMRGLIGIAPRNELEGMMAAQLIAAHSATMECYRRAMLGEQSIDGRRENLNQANKLSRTFTGLLDALNRYRGKGHQKVTVEHVHVHSGGQAIVGTLESPALDNPSKSEGQTNAKQIAHAPQPAMRSPNPGPQIVSSAGDAERSMSNARRTVPRSTKGK